VKTEHVMISVSIAAALAVLPSIALASASSAALAGVDTTEAPRVTQTVNSNVVSTLSNTHLAVIDRVSPVGTVADSTPMNHMQLVLQRSSLRATALDQLIAAQHDPSSSKFHQWITPDEFGQTFGVADADISAVSAWLTSQGFKVNGVLPNKMQIDFSGTAGQVRQAFRTQENQYVVNHVTHIANASDITMPTALQAVVVGVAGLNDFRPQPLHQKPQVAQFNTSTQRFKIQQTTQAQASAKTAPTPMVEFNNGTVRGFAPYDMQTIYNTSPLYTKGFTGTGITIAVVEDQDMDTADWPNFVSQFGLGGYGGTYKQFQPLLSPDTGNCTDPGGNSPDGESIETVLDSEYTTAIAPGANIWVATCNDSGSSNFFGGVFTAASNLINGTSRPNVISASYGYGENFTDAASKTAIDLMWAQADAEGISVFVSTGDSGSNPSFNGSIINGVGVSANSLATSAYNTGVGGSDTADVLDGDSSKYFNTTLNPVYGSAKSYVPEITWNQSCGNTRAAKDLVGDTALQFCKTALIYDPYGYYVTSESGSGGPSSVDMKPSWQRIVHGAAKDQSRDLPDVSLFAGSYGGYSWVILCTGANPCTPNFTSPVTLEGGTSLSSPMFAGIQALIDQGLSNAGGGVDQGNAAPTLYELARNEYGGPTGSAPSTLAACDADNGTKGTSKCVFHNITDGGNSTQCIELQGETPATSDCYYYGTIANFEGFYGPVQVGLTSTSATKYNSTTAAYAAQAGWSFANGLGSVNATNLLSAWKSFNGL
jgi:subtilase family serine protease